MGVNWDADRFASLDLETNLIEGGILAPRIVCGSTADARGARILDRPGILARARALLAGTLIIVGANVAFDLACLVAAEPDLLPQVFKAYAEERVFDVQVAQALHAIAEGNLYQDPRTGEPLKGRYSLERCVSLVLGREDAKARDYWRKRYALLDGVPIDEWPEEAKDYPVDDARNTLEVAVAQVCGGGAGPTPGPHRNLGDLPAQCETAWALHLGAVWGLRTDPEWVRALRERAERDHAAFVERFRALGFFGADGKRDLAAVKRAVVRAYGGGARCGECAGGKVLSPKTGNPVNCKACSGTGLDASGAPTTPAGGVRADRDALAESGDADLAELGDNEAEKTLSTYLPFLEEGLGRPISLRPNVLVASGRTSYDGPIQQMPRVGRERPCFRARPGYVYCSVDYAALELCTFSQVCLWVLGRSQMAETINATGDPGSLHTAFAAALAGRTPEEMTALVKAKDANAKAYRTVAKFCNFALLGGMGAAKFCLLARKKSAGRTTLPDGSETPGVRFCVLIGGADRCGVERVTEHKGRPIPPTCRACLRIADEQLRPSWFRQWGEVPAYFEWVTSRVGDHGRGELPCFATERVRGGLDFTNGANNGFQALAADGAKNALRKLVRECYLDEASSLWGTRPIFFVHDEIVSELPEDRAAGAGPRKAEIMVEAMREYVPDVCVRAEPALMRRWLKDAEPAYVGAGGELGPGGKPWDKSAEGRVLVPWDDYYAKAA